MVLRQDDPRSPARQIVDELRRLIVLGELEPGSQLPSNAEMRNRYDVSNQTAQNAINALKRDGLVYSVPGKGVFVQPDLDRTKLVEQLAGEGSQPELYNELLARLVKLEGAHGELRDELDGIKQRIHSVEERQGVHQADLAQSSSTPDR